MPTDKLTTHGQLLMLANRVKSEDEALGAKIEADIQAAISASGHAHFEKVDAVPAVEDAQENVLYMVMNNETGHYDIYALVSGKVELIDDTTVDLTGYSTTAQMNAAISDAVSAAIGTLDMSNYVTKDELATTLEGYATDEEAAAAAAAAVSDATATDEEISTALDGVFGSET